MKWRLDLLQTNLLNLDVSEKFLSPIRFVNNLYIIYNRLNASWELCDFEKHENM